MHRNGFYSTFVTIYKTQCIKHQDTQTWENHFKHRFDTIHACSATVFTAVSAGMAFPRSWMSILLLKQTEAFHSCLPGLPSYFNLLHLKRWEMSQRRLQMALAALMASSLRLGISSPPEHTYRRKAADNSKGAHRPAHLASDLRKIYLLRSFMNFLKKCSWRQAKQKIQLNKKRLSWICWNLYNNNPFI